MSGRLLDTNHFGFAVRYGSHVFERIKSEVRRGIRVGTCIPVLCEIEVGACNVANPDAYHQGIERVLRHVTLWPMTKRTARLYGEIANDLRRRGRALSQIDIMLAALPWLKTE